MRSHCPPIVWCDKTPLNSGQEEAKLCGNVFKLLLVNKLRAMEYFCARQMNRTHRIKNANVKWPLCPGVERTWNFCWFVSVASFGPFVLFAGEVIGSVRQGDSITLLSLNIGWTKRTKLGHAKGKSWRPGVQITTGEWLAEKKYFELFSSLSEGIRGEEPTPALGFVGGTGGRGAALALHCGFGAWPTELNETGPSENWNGSHPYESPLSVASCLALIKAGKESS